jgi:hypothetical protein
MEGCSSPDIRSPIAPVDMDVVLEPPLGANKDPVAPTVGEEFVEAVTPPGPKKALFVVAVGVESPTLRLIISLNRAVDEDSRRGSPVGGVLAPVDCPPVPPDDDNDPIPELLVTTDNGATPMPPYPKGIEYVMLAAVGVDPPVVGQSLLKLKLLLVRIGGGGGKVGSKRNDGGFEGDMLNAILGGALALLNGPSMKKGMKVTC